jgi:hypothetical protein
MVQSPLSLTFKLNLQQEKLLLMRKLKLSACRRNKKRHRGQEQASHQGLFIEELTEVMLTKKEEKRQSIW